MKLGVALSGSVIEEVELDGDRLHYKPLVGEPFSPGFLCDSFVKSQVARLLEGAGPVRGWVSTKLNVPQQQNGKILTSLSASRCWKGRPCFPTVFLQANASQRRLSESDLISRLRVPICAASLYRSIEIERQHSKHE